MTEPPKRPAIEALIAAAAIGIALPTALPGYFFVLSMMGSGGWVGPWLTTCAVEAALATCGALVGVLAVYSRFGAPRALAIVPLGLMTLVGIGAAVHAGTVDPGYGAAGLLDLVIWIVGTPLGIAVQIGAGSLVWAIARRLEERHVLKTVGAVVVLHVVLKTFSTPIVFGTIAALLGLVLAVRLRDRRGMVAFAVIALAAIAIEVARLLSFEHQHAMGFVVAPF
jgi:hypothetical protein